MLQAIERNDFASLPGGMFRKAYVRTLAAEFGLDADDLAAEYSAIYEAPIAPPVVLHDGPVRQDVWIEQLAPVPRRSIVTLALVSLPVAAWFLLQPGATGIAPQADDAATRFVALRASGSAVTPALDAAGDVVEASAGAPDRLAAPLSIAIEAAGWCWVAAEIDGERALYRLIEPGERIDLEARRAIALRLGDAGAVTLSINGGAAKSIGRSGEVVEIEVTPDNVDGLKDSAVETSSGA